MKLNRTELKKVIYDFNSISNRLLQADFEDYTDVLVKFVRFISDNELIYDYIFDCGECDYNIEEEVNEVAKSYGRSIFSLGGNEIEEVRNVYVIIKYIADNKINVHYGIAMGYSHSNKYQDKVKGFNDRVVMVLIRHIERYLTKIGIDMGMDEKVNYTITVNNGQVNIASDNATINATQNNGIDTVKLTLLIEDIKNESKKHLSFEDQMSVAESLEVIEQEITKDNPRRSFIKTAITGLKAIKGTVEFGAAVTALLEFIQLIN